MPVRPIRRVKLILPALTEATSPFWRPIKYSLFPPLGPGDPRGVPRSRTLEIVLQDEHVEPLDLDDSPRPGRHPGLHHQRLPRLPDRRSLPGAGRPRRARRPPRHVAARRGRAHADTIFLGPGEHTFPRFLRDLARRHTAAPVPNRPSRTLDELPPIRRDLIRRQLYLVPNSIVVSRGCPHALRLLLQGRVLRRAAASFYTQRVDAALAEIARLPGRHLYFLDDHLFGNPRFARRAVPTACEAWAAMFQGAATVDSILRGRRRRTRCGRGPAQPVRRVRDAVTRRARGRGQEPESRPRATETSSVGSTISAS